jgi:pimeloyl-ACP methyl ester carboxylesterase
MKTLLLTSTAGSNEIYFKNTSSYLSDRGVDSEIILPHTHRLEEYRNKVDEKIQAEDEILSLVGWSNAGNIAFDLAEEYPSRIKKSVIVDSVLDWEYQTFRDKITAMCSTLPEGWKDFLFGNDFVVGLASRLMIKDMDGFDPELYQYLVKITKNHGGSWLVNAWGDMREYSKGKDYINRAEKLNEKTELHFIYSSPEVEEYTKLLKVDVKHKHKIKDSGHIIMLEKPEVFNETLLQILED